MEDSLLKQQRQSLSYTPSFFGNTAEKQAKGSLSEMPRMTANSSEDSPSPHINLLSNNVLEAEEFMSKTAIIE